MPIRHSNAKQDQLLILIVVAISYILFSYFDLLERIVHFSAQHEEYEIDEIVSSIIMFAFALVFYAIRRQQEAVQTNIELEQALLEIKTLRGLIPICAVCKKIEADDGAWEQIEAYLQANSDAQFSHGYCPSCFDDEIKKIEEFEKSHSPKR